MRQIAVMLLVAILACHALAQEAPTTRPGTKPAAEKSKNPVAVMKTNFGEIHIELLIKEAPVTVANFLDLAEGRKEFTDPKTQKKVKRNFYDGLTFHRVIKGFMIQGGGFNSEFEKLTANPSIQNEWQNGLKNVHGSIAMARLPSQPDSATNQFFINVKDNPTLDRAQRDGAGYAVFGKVVAGMETVEAIRRTPTRTGVPGKPQLRLRNVPAQTVVIKSVRHISADDAKKVIEKESSVETSPTSRPG